MHSVANDTSCCVKLDDYPVPSNDIQVEQTQALDLNGLGDKKNQREIYRSQTLQQYQTN